MKPEPVAYTSCLRVNRIQLAVHLGVGDDERATPQNVEIDIAFYFPALTQASHTDSGEYICYDKLSHALKAHCETREFHLIEYLAMEIYNIARKAAAPEVKMTLSLHKCRILVPFAQDGAWFTYTDLPPFAWTPPV